MSVPGISGNMSRKYFCSVFLFVPILSWKSKLCFSHFSDLILVPHWTKLDCGQQSSQLVFGRRGLLHVWEHFHLSVDFLSTVYSKETVILGHQCFVSLADTFWTQKLSHLRRVAYMIFSDSSWCSCHSVNSCAQRCGGEQAGQAREAQWTSEYWHKYCVHCGDWSLANNAMICNATV